MSSLVYPTNHLLSHLRFDVPVQYLPIVNVLESETYLYKPVEHLVLGEQLPFLFTDPLIKVTTIAVVHGNVQRATVLK